MEKESKRMNASATLDYPSLLYRNPPTVIHSKAEYEHRRRELQRVLRSKGENLTVAEQRYVELLAVLIEDYETSAFPLAQRSAPLDALRELMAVNGLKQADLLDVFVHKSVVSSVLSGKRRMTVEQIRKLGRKFHISPAVFL
jgi:HTH-type transcriptional regulator / antitoxin HigA